MNDSSSNAGNDPSITGHKFDAPLYVRGFVSNEPEMYLGEKPYELSKYDYGVLKKGQFRSDFWFQITCGATVGLVLALLGKALYALIRKTTPSLESWELCTVLVGIATTLVLKLRKKNNEEMEFDEVRQTIDQHFYKSPKRRIHILSQEKDSE